MPIRRGLEIFLFGIICLIPIIGLFTFENLIYPYVTTKHYLFRAAIITAAGLWGALITIDPSLRPRYSRLLLSLGVFLTVVFIADLQGSNFISSFWSNYSRMEGFLSLIFYSTFFLIFGAVVRTSKNWNFYWMIQVVVSVIIMIIAILQKLNVLVPVDFNRVDSVFGNASYLAIYSSLIFFLCLYHYLSVQTRWIKLLIAMAALGNLVSIYLSQTRSAVVGILISVGLFVFLMAKNKKKAAFYMASLFILFLVSIFIFKSRSGLTTNLFARFANISTKDGSVQARMAIWEYCFNAIVAQPWLGWGQENFSYLAPFYHPGLWSTPWVDRSHNLVIEWMVNAGILGLLAYLLVLYFLTISIYVAEPEKLLKPQKAALLSLLLCWGINQFLSIDFFSISILFYSVMAFGHFVSLKKNGLDRPAVKMRSSKQALLVVLFLMISVFVNYNLNYKSYLTNENLLKATRPESLLPAAQRNPPEFAIEQVVNQTQFNEAQDARVFLVQNALFVLSQARVNKAYEELAQHYYRFTDSYLQKMLKTDSDDLFFKHLAAAFYSQYQNFPAAEVLYQNLIERVPHQQYYIIDYANLKLAEGDPVQALNLYRRASDLEPLFPMGKMFLALGYVYNERYAEANAIVDQLMREGSYDVFDQRLVDALLFKKQTQKAQDILSYKQKYK